MRLMLLALVAVFVVMSGQVFAGPYDEIWIKECIQDNQDQGQTADTIRIYCKCMTDKMPESENRSVTMWEKTHPEEMEYCSDLAKWKGR